MKKFKFINPLILAPCLVSTALPITLVACKENSSPTASLTSLMSIYKPKEAPAPADYYVNCKTANDVVNKYFDRIDHSTKFFKEDLLFTLTRSVQTFVKSLKDNGVSIKTNNFKAKITEVLLTRTTTNISVKFDLQLNINYSYGKESETVLKDTFGIYYQSYNTKGKYRFVLDFNTKNFDQYAGYSKLEQLLVNDNAANFGISEMNSTFSVLEEKGSKKDFAGKTEKINLEYDPEKHPEGHATYHFIAPNDKYWSEYESSTDYEARLEEFDNLLNSGRGIIINLFNGYERMSRDTETCLVPNEITFGSYHSKNASLVDTFEFTDDVANTACYGFNYSNSTEANMRKLAEEDCFDAETKAFTLPTVKYTSTQQEVTIKEIANNAFNAVTSARKEAAVLPDIVEKLVVPTQTTLIGKNAFVFDGANNVKAIEFMPTTGSPCVIDENAFAHFTSLTQLDFHNLNATYVKKMLSNGSIKADAFTAIHEGFDEELDEDKRGHIYLSQELLDDQDTKNRFVEALRSAGLIIPNNPIEELGWVVDYGEPQN